MLPALLTFVWCSTSTGRAFHVHDRQRRLVFGTERTPSGRTSTSTARETLLACTLTPRPSSQDPAITLASSGSTHVLPPPPFFFFFFVPLQVVILARATVLAAHTKRETPASSSCLWSGPISSSAGCWSLNTASGAVCVLWSESGCWGRLCIGHHRQLFSLGPSTGECSSCRLAACLHYSQMWEVLAHFRAFALSP